MKSPVRFAVVTISLGAASTASFAAESVLPITPPGGTDIAQALLPPTGLYVGAVSIPYNYNAHSTDAIGNDLPSSAAVRFNIIINGIFALYVYPFRPFGGQLSTSAVLPYQDVHYRGAISSHYDGFADLYSDVLFYTKNIGQFGAKPGNSPYLQYGLNVGGGLSMIFPTGRYSRTQPISPSANIYNFIPTLAATYVTGPNMSLGDTTEISARAFFGEPLANPATHYKDGNVADVDFSITEGFSRLTVGVAGFYEVQYGSDTPPDGRAIYNNGKFSYMTIGPIAQYVFKDGTALKAKYSNYVFSRNFPTSNSLVFSIAKQF